MKASIITRIVCWSLAAILLTGLLLVGLGWHILGNIGHFFSESLAGNFEEVGSYTVSADTVRRLDIDWASGSVLVEPYDGEEIRIVERAQRSLRDKEKLYYEADGNKLKISYTKPHVVSFFLSLPRKQLEIQIPAALADTLSNLDVDSASADITVRELSVRELSLQSASGNLTANSLVCDKLSLESVSGNTRADRIRTEKLDAETVSGDVVLSGRFSILDMEGVSGRLSAIAESCPNELDVNTVSGDITLSIPENDGFAVRYSKVSGDFLCDFPTRQDGKRAVYQNGGADFRMETVSGDLIIQKHE